MRYLRNTSDLHDALQDSFVNIFKSLEQYDPAKSEFHTWATRICINCALKKNKVMYKIETDELPESSKQISHIPCVMEQMNDSELLSFLEKMPKDYLTVFNLYMVDGYSHREISDLVGIHENLSRQRLSRARAWVKERLTAEGELVSAMKNRI
jgi:RNA polymerase sigma-70 factor (ECF subfamily)